MSGDFSISNEPGLRFPLGFRKEVAGSGGQSPEELRVEPPRLNAEVAVGWRPNLLATRAAGEGRLAGCSPWHFTDYQCK